MTPPTTIRSGPAPSPSSWPRRVRLVAFAVLPAVGCVTCGEPEQQSFDLEGDDESRVLEIVLPEPPAETNRTEPLARPAPGIHDVVQHLRAAARRDPIEGVFLHVGPMQGAWGRAGDLVSALRNVRGAGKPVHCHFDSADNVAYYLVASVCDRINMSPAGHLDLVGPSAQVVYARKLMERIGVEAELFQMGRYKSAGDQLMRKRMPDSTREALGAILDDLHATLVSAVEKGRGLSHEEARAVVDEGPYSADRARDRGLVDDVGFDDEAREHARRAADVSRVRKAELAPERKQVGLGDLVRMLTGGQASRVPQGARIALVQLEGSIVEAKHEGLRGVRSGPFVRTLRDMAGDDAVKAVVLRISSPGGSALASDRMWHAVRRAAKQKPVIASIGDMAASGGYYVASAATRIVAHPASLVGSIGVVGGKVQAAKLADRMGVNAAMLARGRHATWSSPLRSFTEDEREIVRRLLRDTYHRFLHRVAEGRDMPRDKVRKAAEGRLMTGKRGKELGLVDELASLGDALHHARSTAGLERDAPVEQWPRPRSLLDFFAGRVGERSSRESARELVTDLIPGAEPVAKAALRTVALLSTNRVTVSLPYVLQLK